MDAVVGNGLGSGLCKRMRIRVFGAGAAHPRDGVTRGCACPKTTGRPEKTQLERSTDMEEKEMLEFGVAALSQLLL